MKIRILFFVIVLFLLGKYEIVFCSEKNELIEIRDSITKYYYKWNSQKFQEIINKTEILIKKNPKNHYLYYYNGIANLCLGKIVYNTNSDLAFDCFDKSVESFNKVIEIKETAENLALLSASYGKKSSLAGINAIFWGIKSKNRIIEAFEKDSNSVEVLLTAATHLMHTPKIYGGDKKKSKELLNKALTINKSKLLKDTLLINWAEDAEIYAYLAQVYILENNIPKAEEYMKKVLQIIPDYGFVLMDLKKQIEKIK